MTMLIHNVWNKKSLGTECAADALAYEIHGGEKKKKEKKIKRS